MEIVIKRSPNNLSGTEVDNEEPNQSKTNSAESVKPMTLELKNINPKAVEPTKNENKEKNIQDLLTTINSNTESKTKTDLIKMFKNSYINFLQYSTIGGLSELGRSNNLFFIIFWMIFVFGCVSYTIITIAEKVNEFNKYSVVLKEYKFQEIPTRYPSVTICNEISFNEKYAFKYLKKTFNFTRKYYDYIYPISNSNGHMTDFYFVYDTVVGKIPSVNQLKRTIINSLNETQLSNLGFNLDSDMLISCHFNGKPCSEANGDFKRFWSNNYGNCYTFNNNHYAYLTGVQLGLQMEMIIGKIFILYIL